MGGRPVHRRHRLLACSKEAKACPALPGHSSCHNPGAIVTSPLRTPVEAPSAAASDDDLDLERCSRPTTEIVRAAAWFKDPQVLSFVPTQPLRVWSKHQPMTRDEISALSILSSKNLGEICA